VPVASFKSIDFGRAEAFQRIPVLFLQFSNLRALHKENSGRHGGVYREDLTK
jgi:hypothetical protein